MNNIKNTLKKFTNKFQNIHRERVSFDEMWFINKNIEKINFSPFIKNSLQELKENGFTILKKNLSDQLCDDLINDFKKFTISLKNSEKYRDAYGLHERLCNLQLISDAARKVCFNKNVSQILNAAFGGDFTLVGSLFFEKGSCQSIHRDTPAFFTNPLNHFFGVWNALEDIKEGSGPLIYYPKGHKIMPDKELYLNEKININNYFKKIEKKCIESGLKLQEFYPEKGDTLIWHPQLPHGGLNKTREGLSRKSFVYHCIPRNIPIYGTEKFFESNKFLPNKKIKILKFSNNFMIDQVEPRFFHNFLDGNFGEV